MRFSDVTGQEQAKEKLIYMCREKRVSHALLFFGPAGSGGLLLARAFAQYLTCENPGAADSCGKCSACLKNEKLAHPDVHYVYPVVTHKSFKKPVSTDFIPQWRNLLQDNPYLNINEWIAEIADTENKQGFIPVDESNEIIHKVNLKAFEAPYKVFILWMPELMRIDTATKLLKTLEEPADNTVFILVTENRDVLMPTIISRTQLVKLKRLTADELTERLISALNIPRGEAMETARLSDGDFNTALELSSERNGEGGHATDFLNWMRLCFNPLKTMDKLQEWVEGMAAEGREKQKQFLFACLQVLRECMIANVADASLSRMDNAQQQSLQRFLPYVGEHNATEFAAILNEGYFHIERNAQPKILFLDLSLKISSILQMK